MAASSRATMRCRSSSVCRFSGRAKCDDASQWGSLLIQARAAHRASSSSVNNNSGFIARSPGSRAGPDTDYRSDDLYGHLSGLRRGLRKKIAQDGPKCNPQNYQDRGRNYWKFPNFARVAQKDVPGLRSEAEETRLAPTQPQSGARRQEKGQADCGLEPPSWAPGMLTCDRMACAIQTFVDRPIKRSWLGNSVTFPIPIEWKCSSCEAASGSRSRLSRRDVRCAWRRSRSGKSSHADP